MENTEEASFLNPKMKRKLKTNQKLVLLFALFFIIFGTCNLFLENPLKSEQNSGESEKIIEIKAVLPNYEEIPTEAETPSIELESKEPVVQENTETKENEEEPTSIEFSEKENEEPEQNISEFEEVHDLGIKDMSTEDKEETETTKITIENHGNCASENTLCLNISSKDFEGESCREISLESEEERAYDFDWPKVNGSFELFAYLVEEDANLSNQNISQIYNIGPIHDLGIKEVNVSWESPNLKTKAVLFNFGTEQETCVKLRRTILGENFNETKYYPSKGCYNSSSKVVNPGRTRTFSYTKKLNQTGQFNITFQILNYSNFYSDLNEENNIKTIETYLTE